MGVLRGSVSADVRSTAGGQVLGVVVVCENGVNVNPPVAFVDKIHV